MWYYSQNGGQEGPIEEGALIQLFLSGTLPPSTFVWRDGLPDWLPVGQTELAVHLPATAAATGGQPRLITGGQPQTNPAAQLRPGATLGGGSALGAPAARQGALGNPYQPPQATGFQGPQLKNTLTWSQILWSFQGRIPRRTFWGASLIWVGILMLFSLIAPVLGSSENSILPFVFLGLFLFFLVAYTWSMIAIQVKRWHDRGKSGAMVLINFIPIVGGIWAFVECGCLRGTDGPNQYGDDPT
jgi:uncharacterized membrane protein YhaH (DUF805 family)